MKLTSGILSAAALAFSVIVVDGTDSGVRGTFETGVKHQRRKLGYYDSYGKGGSGKGGSGKGGSGKGGSGKGGSGKGYGGKGYGGKGGSGKGYSGYRSKGKGKGGSYGEKVAFDFIQEPYDFDAGIPPTGSTDPFAVGTVYLWNCLLYNATTYDFSGDPSQTIGFTTGTCTRLYTADGTLPGLGYCSFTYSFGGGTSVTVAGEMADFFGGLVAVVGGTGEFVGASGQLSLTPLNHTFGVEGGDIFEDVAVYGGSIHFKVDDYHHYW